MQHHYIAENDEHINVYDIIESTCKFNRKVSISNQSQHNLRLAHKQLISVNRDSPRVLLIRCYTSTCRCIDELDVNFSSVKNCIIDTRYNDVNLIGCTDEYLFVSDYDHGYLWTYNAQLDLQSTIANDVFACDYIFTPLNDNSIAMIKDDVRLFDITCERTKTIAPLDELYEHLALVSTNENTLYLFSGNDIQGYVIDFRNESNSRMSIHQFNHISRNACIQRITDTHIILEYYNANQTRETVLYDTRNDQYLNLYTWNRTIGPKHSHSIFTAY